jgi:hypothetical protein
MLPLRTTTQELYLWLTNWAFFVGQSTGISPKRLSVYRSILCDQSSWRAVLSLHVQSMCEIFCDIFAPCVCQRVSNESVHLRRLWAEEDVWVMYSLKCHKECHDYFHSLSNARSPAILTSSRQTNIAFTIQFLSSYPNKIKNTCFSNFSVRTSHGLGTLIHALRWKTSSENVRGLNMDVVVDH